MYLLTTICFFVASVIAPTQPIERAIVVPTYPEPGIMVAEVPPLPQMEMTHLEPVESLEPIPEPVAPTPEPEPIQTASNAPSGPSIVAGCGDNFYANYIYMHESDCNLNAVNSQGCRGIGQACPGSKLPCGADYACQNAFFTRYAMDRYGSWEGAYNFWINNHWW